MVRVQARGETKDGGDHNMDGAKTHSDWLATETPPSLSPLKGPEVLSEGTQG